MPQRAVRHEIEGVVSPWDTRICGKSGECGPAGDTADRSGAGDVPSASAASGADLPRDIEKVQQGLEDRCLI